MSESEIYDRRAMISRGVVLAVDDSGAMQTLTVQTHTGVIRTGVEVYAPYGQVSVPPAGAEVAVLQVGGDAGDCIALPASHASARAGGADPGTCGWADAGGNRVIIKPDGSVEIVSATQVKMQVGDCTFLLTSAGLTLTTPDGTTTFGASGVTFSQPVTMTQDLTVNGAIHGTADKAKVAGSIG